MGSVQDNIFIAFVIGVNQENQEAGGVQLGSKSGSYQRYFKCGVWVEINRMEFVAAG